MKERGPHSCMHRAPTSTLTPAQENCRRVHTSTLTPAQDNCRRAPNKSLYSEGQLFHNSHSGTSQSEASEYGGQVDSRDTLGRTPYNTGLARDSQLMSIHANSFELNDTFRQQAHSVSRRQMYPKRITQYLTPK